MRLDKKTALVTGAARGIGAAIAEAFEREGAVVWLSDILENEGGAVVDRLGDNGRFIRLDVRDEEDWKNAVEELIDRDGRLDILVNNAGVTGFETGSEVHDPEHAALAAWRRVHETNLDGVFLGCKHAIRAMRAHGSGSIINISSRSGMVGIPAAAAYASSKAAVRNHTKTIALYCADQDLNIRCNAILPAAILTPMWDPLLGQGPEREQRTAAFVADTPLRRCAASVARKRSPRLRSCWRPTKPRT